LAEVGVLLLLFDVGLQVNLRAFARVGPSAVLVALIGVVLPFFLGWGTAVWFLPNAPTLVHIFIGATHIRTNADDSTLRELLVPLSELLVPLFFVLMGSQVDLSSLLEPSAMALGTTIIIAASSGNWSADWVSSGAASTA